MKTKTTNKPKQPTAVNESAKAESAKDAFRKTIGKQDGANSIVEKFFAVMEQLTKNSINGTFSVMDAIHYGKAFELGANDVKDLFLKWTDKEVQLGRLQRIEGCYEWSIYKVISTKSFLTEQV
jgi:hypothetical protein